MTSRRAGMVSGCRELIDPSAVLGFVATARVRRGRSPLQRALFAHREVQRLSLYATIAHWISGRYSWRNLIEFSGVDPVQARLICGSAHAPRVLGAWERSSAAHQSSLASSQET